MAENNLRETFKYIEWKISKIIERFGRRDERRREVIQSRNFRFNNAELFLKISSNAITSGSLCISLHNVNPEEYFVNLRIGIQKTDGFNTNIIEQCFTFMEGSNSSEYGFNKVFSMLENSTDILTPDGTLTIFCFICTHQEPPMDNESQSPLPEAEMSPVKRLKTVDDIANKDVILNVGGTEFLAHRFILVQRSNYFAEKLPPRPVGATGRQPAFIPGDLESFGQFLQFLYSKDIRILTLNNMIGIYKNSNTCKVGDLKEECVRFMKQELTIHTFSVIYDLSCEHNDTDLLKSSIQFFKNNAKRIVITTKWQEYLKKKPLNGNKLFRDYFMFE